MDGKVQKTKNAGEKKRQNRRPKIQKKKNDVKMDSTSKKAPRTQKTPHIFQMSPGPSKPVVTARDLVNLIPKNEGGFTIFYDPEKGEFGLRKKEEMPEEVETVAKARGKSFGHTLIFTKTGDGPGGIAVQGSVGGAGQHNVGKA